MNFTPDGRMTFDSYGELLYNLFSEIGLGIDDTNQYLFDLDSRITLKFNDKYIKANVNNMPIYAGKNDIIFDPLHNYGLMVKMFGYYIDKESNNEDREVPFNFISHGIIESDDRQQQKIFIDTNLGRIESNFYYCGYLGYIECIFKIAGFNVFLKNFDDPELKKRK